MSPEGFKVVAPGGKPGDYGKNTIRVPEGRNKTGIHVADLILATLRGAYFLFSHTPGFHPGLPP